MTAGPDLSLNGWAVLTVLVDDGPAHGFAISRKLSKTSDIGLVWAVSRPLVYRALDQLESAGLVQAEEVLAGDGGPNRRPFRATPTGHRAVATWRTAPVSHLRDVRAELILKLVLAERTGLDPSDLLVAQLAHFSSLVAELADERRGSTGSGHVVDVWRHELSVAVERTLTTLLAEQPRPARPTDDP